MSIAATLYKKIVPSRIRNIFLKNKILQYYSSHAELHADPEWSEVAARLQGHPLEIFPYNYADKYKESDIEVFLDDQSGLHYVYLDNKKLYFKKSWNPEKIRRNYNRLRIEQDVESPHYYTSPDFDVMPGDVVADIGSAEGNFSITIIEKVKKLYLFECDPGWLEALKKTFEPWKDKVEIIPQYVSDEDNINNCRGGDFFSGKQIDFLKIDVDGGERPLLAGFGSLLNDTAPLKIAICTYHRQQDEIEFTQFLKEKGFAVSHGNRYMIFYHDKMISAPFLRRGLIRAIR